MTAFVTGGTGFIGSHLVDNLLGEYRSDQVRCLVRNHDRWLTGKSVTRVHSDLFNLSDMRRALQGVEIVYHIAGMVKAPSERELLHANVEATETLIRLAAKSGVKKVIVLSSLAAVGPSNGSPVTETVPMNPISSYGRSKMKMEEMIRSLDLPDMTITILRPPAVYGPREEQIYTWFKLLNKRFSPVIGDGTSPRLSMIYVSDLIRGIRLAEKIEQPGVYTFFLTGPEIVNWNQIRKIGSKVLGKRSIPLYIRPNWVSKIAGAVESTASLFGAYPAFNREKAREMVHEWTCSSRKAETELGYRPEVDLEEGISRTIHWYKKHHWL